MTEVPPALIAALRALPASAWPQQEIGSSRVSRGDLRFARGLPGESHEAGLVLVLSVDSDHDFVEILLLHTAAEMACDVDVVVPRGVSGAPYDVVVQTDLRGVVWTLQLGPLVARLDHHVLSALGSDVNELASDHPSTFYRGLPLAGPSDPRWAFKRHEGVDLRRLTRDSTEALLDEGNWIVDSGLLRPGLLDLAEDPAALVFELVHWVRTRSLELGPAEVETLLEMGALDTDAWAAVGDLGLDIWTAIQGLVVSSATATERRGENTGSWRFLTATHLEAHTWSAVPDLVHYLGRKEPAAA
jgi:hypothetical protein